MIYSIDVLGKWDKVDLKKKKKPMETFAKSSKKVTMC
jgi:hypothetical protein